MKTLLLVDDDELIRAAFSELLSSSCRVLTAPGGAEALELLQREEVDLILSDQCMPGMTGDEFLSRAARLHPDIERVLITGYASLEAVIRGVNGGNIGYYLEKPIQLAQLLPVVQQGFARTHERRQQRRAAELFETIRAVRQRDVPPKPFVLWAVKGTECLVVDEVMAP